MPIAHWLVCCLPLLLLFLFQLFRDPSLLQDIVDAWDEKDVAKLTDMSQDLDKHTAQLRRYACVCVCVCVCVCALVCVCVCTCVWERE